MYILTHCIIIMPVYYIISLYFHIYFSSCSSVLQIIIDFRSLGLMCNIMLSPSPQDLMQLKLDLQEAVMVKEEQEEVLRRRERELTALKGALKEEVSSHDQEVDKLREQYEKELRKLQASLEEFKQVMCYHLPF